MNQRAMHIVIGVVIALLCATYAASLVFTFFARLNTDAARPWTIIEYAYYYGADPRIAKHLLLGVVAGVFVGAGVLYMFFSPKSSGIYGDARWARRDEVKQAGLFSDFGFLVGRLGSLTSKLLCMGGGEHILVYAPTGSGKGVAIVVPNLLHWRDSAIVHDMKGENFRITSGFRAAHGQKVFFFNPADPDGNTHCYNPLDFISLEPGRRVDDIQKIAHILIPGDAAKFWPPEARTLFLGLVLYLLDIKPMPATFGNVLRITRSHPDFALFLAGILDKHRHDLDPAGFGALNSFLQKQHKERSGVLSTLSAALELWANPVIEAATSRSDFDLNTLKKVRTTIYVGVTPNNLDRLRPLLQVVYEQGLDFFTTREPGPDEPFKVAMVMDEFAGLRKMQKFLDTIAYLRGYGVRLLMIVQGPSQLDEHYLIAGRRTFFQNSKIRIAYAPNDYDTADMISKQLGTMTVKTKSKSLSRPELLFGDGKYTSSESESQTGRALLMPQELMQLDPKYEIIQVEGFPPIKAKKIRYYSDRIFKSRLLPPAPVPKITISRAAPLPPLPAAPEVPADAATLPPDELEAVLAALNAVPSAPTSSKSS